MSGNLGFQVEHHLYPDMPSSRYQQISHKVKRICDRYGLPYNTGPFGKQFGGVQRTILRLAFPGGKPRPKPGPYKIPPEPAAAPEQNGNGTLAHARTLVVRGARVVSEDAGRPQGTQRRPAVVLSRTRGSASRCRSSCR